MSTTALEVGQIAVTRPIPGYVVAFDPAHPDRMEWEGTDLAFVDRTAAEQFLSGRLSSWPQLPFRLYALVHLPDARDGVTVTGIRVQVDTELVDGGAS